MKNILLLLSYFMFTTGCQQTSEKSTSELDGVRLDFTNKRTQVYEATSRVITKASKTELRGTFKIKVKENELADLIFEFNDNRSEVPVLGNVEFQDTTIVTRDMNSKGLFPNGNEHPEMLFEALIPIGFSGDSEIILKMPMSQSQSKDKDFFEMKMVFQKTKADSISKQLKFEGKFNESKTYDQPFEYKVEVTGMGEYVFNQEDLHFDHVSLRMNVYTEMHESGFTSLTNYSTILKYLRTE